MARPTRELVPGLPTRRHRASDLTVDHVVPLAAGGAPLDIANYAVLCRSCNSTKGADNPPAEGRGGVAHKATGMHADRASRMCGRGRVSREIPRVADLRTAHVPRWAPPLAHVPR